MSKPTPQIATVIKPPKEVFMPSSAIFQEAQESVISGYYFEKMEYPEEGGMFVHYYDQPYPCKGNPFTEATDAIHIPKKIFKIGAFFIKAHKITAVIILLLPNFIMKRYIKSFMEHQVRGFAYHTIMPYLLMPDKWCKMVREIRRAGLKISESYDEDLKKDLQVIIELVASVLEYDNAWRYRVQDIIGEIDKEAFKINPSKEIQKLIVLEVRRERGWGSDDKGRFVDMGKALKAIMFFKPFIKKILQDFVYELNIEEIKLDEADEYYCLLRPDYDIHGIPFEKRYQTGVSILNKYKQDNSKRIEEALKSQEIRGQIFDGIKSMVTQEKGFPLLMFYAVEDSEVDENGKRKITVKKMETITLKNNPPLKDICRDFMINSST